ncbi:hypothetical protein [Bradyrhizobium sp. 191]|uniref:hypothetical protein n=1 Tax=Bradyrhizobium sp. 191 TaxID=2782659 RepID=UPI001FFEE59F|nr:hypothetical protein [Bradyrhizobium sp. 191]UPJ65248.1 hypothetical protein IVB23_35885 [Bradyrhizobium sp. 191]
MKEQFEFTADLTAAQQRLVMMLFMQCYQQAIIQISRKAGPLVAAEIHRAIVAALKNADIVAPIDDEAKATQFVVTMLNGIIEIKG